MLASLIVKTRRSGDTYSLKLTMNYNTYNYNRILGKAKPERSTSRTFIRLITCAYKSRQRVVLIPLFLCEVAYGEKSHGLKIVGNVVLIPLFLCEDACEEISLGLKIAGNEL